MARSIDVGWPSKPRVGGSNPSGRTASPCRADEFDGRSGSPQVAQSPRRVPAQGLADKTNARAALNVVAAPVKRGAELVLGDTVSVWWSKSGDTVVSFRSHPKPHARIAVFAKSGGGMRIDDDALFELLGRLDAPVHGGGR